MAEDARGSGPVKRPEGPNGPDKTCDRCHRVSLSKGEDIGPLSPAAGRHVSVFQLGWSTRDWLSALG